MTETAIKQSKNRPTVGRVLQAYSNKWTGPRPALVVNTFESNENLCNVNVLFDGANDRAMLSHVRQSPSGNTFASVAVYDALKETERAAALAAATEREPVGVRVILEWPLIPPPAAKPTAPAKP